jgi:NADH-quinone oxidoreductase subunit C
MALTNLEIEEKVKAKFGDSVKQFTEPWGMLTFEVDRDRAIELLQFLRDEPVLNFNFLTTMSAIHYPDNEIERQFVMVYHLHNWIDNVRIRFKTYLNGENPEIETATTVFDCANWMERQEYDFFGVIFTGHPDLKRILNMDELISFPLRKEFPMEDRWRTDKDDRFFGREPYNKDEIAQN